MKHLLIALLSACGLILAPPVFAAGKVPPSASNQSGFAIAEAGQGRRVVGPGRTAAAPHRIVIQVNEEDGKKWIAVLANIRNIQAELGAQNVRLAVVAIGPGLGMITADSIAANEVQDALAAGVEFVACGNSMKAQHIDKADLVEGIGVATAGYVEIAKRQQQGWAYLRP